MEKYLSVLLAHFVVLQYKIHCIHTSSKGMCWKPLHEFYGEIYSFFGDDNIDLIKERAEILGESTPYTLASLLKLSSIQELTEIPDTVTAKQIIIADLKKIEGIVGGLMNHYESDLVTQDLMISLGDTIGKMRWKLESRQF